MPTPKLTTPIEIDRYYHIFNRGNNHELLFYKEFNYSYFLNKYDKYLSEHVSTFAYCLMPNHFHLLIKTKTDSTSKQLRKLFQSYALSINKQENRTGSLFTKPFRRIAIEDNEYSDSRRVKQIRRFHEIFLDMIQRYGRNYELRMMAEFNIRLLLIVLK